MRLPLLLSLLLLTFSLDGCDLTMNIQQLRVAHTNYLNIDKNNRWICVVTPKRDTYTIMSLSFLPTTCIAYPQDVYPEPHPFSKDHTIFRVRVLRDQCASDEMSKEPFIVTIKSGYQYTEGRGFDKAVPVYFAVAVTIAFLVYFPIRRMFCRLFREDEGWVGKVEHYDMTY